MNAKHVIAGVITAILLCIGSCDFGRFTMADDICTEQGYSGGKNYGKKIICFTDSELLINPDSQSPCREE